MWKNVRIFISSSADKLRSFLSGFVHTVTVEAEYGDDVVEGSLLTLAHHGPRSGNPAPCLNSLRVVGGGVVITIGISHLDLDTLGGILSVVGLKPNADEFWKLAAFIDINGPHKLNQFPKLTDELGDQIQAYWAWSEKNRVFAPRDGSVEEVTGKVLEAFNVLRLILANDQGIIRQGREWGCSESCLE